MNDFNFVFGKKNPLLLGKVNQRILKKKNLKKNVIFSNKKCAIIIKRKTIKKISNVKIEKKSIIK
jgi:hypothetical protein